MKLDCHYHLGRSYSSKGRDFHREKTTVESTLEYIQKEKLTHLVVLYVKEERELVRDLINKTSIKIYPFIWLKELSIDEIDFNIDKGIKLHGLRTDYEIDSHKVYKLYSQLPSNFMVLAHTQGSTSHLNKNCPTSFVKGAIKFSKLKFIIGHSGDFGFLSWEAGKKELNQEKILKYKFQSEVKRQLVLSACRYAKKFENVLTENSSFWPAIEAMKWKGEFLWNEAGDKWCFGSDIPFSWGNPMIVGIGRQEYYLKRYLPFITQEDINKIHENGINFLEKEL